MPSPKTVILIRHGEKPHDGGPPHGVNRHGEHDGHSLSVRGWTRAGALAAVFAHTPHPAHPLLVTPQRIFATRPSHEARSTRERDTAVPTALRLGLDIDDSIRHGDEDGLVRAILERPEDALAVWHHGTLVDVVRSFPLANPHEVPQSWPDDRFDLYWILTSEQGPTTGYYRFSAVPQRLLAGDAQE